MKTMLRFAAALLASFAAAAIAQTTSPAAQAVRMTSDTPQKTPAGAAFTAPTDWTVARGARTVTLTAPEGDSRIVLVDGTGKDAGEAVASAWAAYKADFKRPLKAQLPQPAIDGWEERQAFTYETSPNERLNVQAIAARAGASWTVIILDATDPVLEKRGSQVGLVFRIEQSMAQVDQVEVNVVDAGAA